MFVCGWNFVCRTISYLRRQTFRPYGTAPPMLNGCYKHFVPTGRFPRSTIVLQTCRPSGTVPTFYDCATNIPSLRNGPPMLNGFSTNIPSLWVPSLWDGSPGSTIVLQTCRPSGTVLYDCATNILV